LRIQCRRTPRTPKGLTRLCRQRFS
jgi:hypothetical protein